MDNFSNNIVVIIPSLNPDENMVKYVHALDKYFNNILIVNDGSDQNTLKYFDEASQYKSVSVIHHPVNQGKGRALKTAFLHVIKHFKSQDIKGVVTADADGQHSVNDTIKVAKTLYQSESFILGTRDFNSDNVPFKSRSGNKITTAVFSLLYGKWIRDTQTGLRGIPFNYLSKCIDLAGERFDYEIMMLIDIVKQNQSIIEVPIDTIYIDSNRATHFNAVKDSMRIYKIIFRMFFKFSISGISSFLVDILIFSLLTKFIFSDYTLYTNVLWSTVIARIISSIINYILNKKMVFLQKGNLITSVCKYYALCILQLFCSWLLVVNVYNQLHFNTSIIKVFVDTILFFISFQIQQHWVFSGGKK